MTLDPVMRLRVMAVSLVAMMAWSTSLLIGTASICQTLPNVLSKSRITMRPNASRQRISRSNTLIEPGKSVGLLSLGDSKERAFEIFTFKADQDQEWEDDCGTTLNWVSVPDKRGAGGGNVFVKFRDDKVVQIESATTRFHTKEGITTYDSPEMVRGSYKNLRAYVLQSSPVRALGDRPLVFWVDKMAGIAFVFAYDRKQDCRYLYKIVVFKPNTDLCPEEEAPNSPSWHEIAPYSLEPPDTIA
jgi:hypothetical protein